MTVYKPDLGEYERLSAAAILRRYGEIERYFPEVIHSLKSEELDREFEAELNVGKWSCRILIGHLADAEISFTHRMRRIVGENNPLFEVWDEDSFIQNGVYRAIGAPIRNLINILKAHRVFAGDWMLSLEDSAFNKIGIHPVIGEQTLRNVLNYSTWHLEHHGTYLLKKLELLSKR